MKRQLGSKPNFAMWVILGVALIVLGSVMAGNLYSIHEQILEHEERHLQHQTEIIQQIMDQSLLALDSVLEHLATHNLPSEISHNLNHELVYLANGMPGVRSLAIYDKLGDVLSSNRAELIGNNFSFRPYFQTVLNNPDPDTLFISPPFLTSLGAYTIVTSKMIPGPDGEFAGIVVAVLDPTFFIPLLDSVMYAPEMWVTLVHADGTIFITRPEKYKLAGVNVARKDTLFTRHIDSKQDTNTILATTPLTKEFCLIVTKTLHPDGIKTDAPLYLGIARDYEAIFHQWRNDAYIQVAIYCIFSILLSCMLYFFQLYKKRSNILIDNANRRALDRQHFINIIADNVPGLVSYWNSEMRCEYANNAYLEWFGKTAAEVYGITLLELMGEERLQVVEPHVLAVLQGEPQAFARNLIKPDGSIGYTLARYIPDIEDGKVKGFFALVTDVTELKDAQNELEKRVQELDTLASTDHLTGLSNRRTFLDQVQEEIARGKRYATPLCFLMLDVDNFKKINDRLGHDVGDEVLKTLGHTMKTALRATDRVGRLGGEEFGVLLPHTNLEDARQYAERLRKLLKDHCAHVDDKEICFTVSIGAALLDAQVNSVEELLKHADVALYHAKNSGRDRVFCFDTDCSPPS